MQNCKAAKLKRGGDRKSEGLHKCRPSLRSRLGRRRENSRGLSRVARSAIAFGGGLERPLPDCSKARIARKALVSTLAERKLRTRMALVGVSGGGALC
jgi:hypothetical protein